MVLLSINRPYPFGKMVCLEYADLSEIILQGSPSSSSVIQETRGLTIMACYRCANPIIINSFVRLNNRRIPARICTKSENASSL